MSTQSAYIPASQLDEKEYKRRVRAWTMYDWANSAFATTILAAVLPFYYSAVAGATLSSAAVATQYWSVTLSITIFIGAVLSPILGTISDIKRGKKKFLSLFITIGVIGTGLLVLVDTGDWLMASLFFILGRVGFAGANVFYDALLPHVAKESDIDRVSTRGYALGYLGGGLLLAVNVAMIQIFPGTWGPRLSFLSVALWWAVFSIPLFRTVPEPPSATEKLKKGESLIKVSFARIWETLREVRQYRELFKFLIAFLIYNDGIGIIISIAVIYTAELGFGLVESVLAILLVQFVGIPFSLVFGNLPNRQYKRQSTILAFVTLSIILIPLVGIGGKLFLSRDLTGTPSAPFTDTATAVGQGSYAVNSGEITLDGNWQVETVPAGARGADEDAAYASTDAAGDQISFTYNGQKVEITYAAGPDFGIWAVQLDGQPYLEEGEPVTIDAYNPALRYDETVDITAGSEGEHTLTLINTGEKSAESSGTRLAISQITVLPPLRASNLGAVLGILLLTELVCVLLAFLLGPTLFKGLAASMNTKRAIMLALAAYSIIAIWGFFLNSVIEFWFLAWMVAIVQGGSQALSRSLYAAMSPTSMSGEFFGLFSIMSKFASFFSPLVFAASVAIFSSSRRGVLSIVFFFIAGMIILYTVNVEEGKRVAKEKDKEMLAGSQ